MEHLGQKIIITILLGMLPFNAMGAKDMILVPAGEFLMPAKLDKKPRKVRSFYIDKKPITNAEYLDFVTANPDWQKTKVKKIFADKNYLASWKSDLDFGPKSMAQSPVVQVSWYAARAFCDSQGKRLATVDEWEYVGQMPFKDKKDLQTVILEWYGAKAPWPLPAVMSRAPNVIGIFDLHGLIWEWTEDFNSSMVTGESRADTALDRNLFCGGGAADAADPSNYAAFMRYALRSSLKAKYTVQNLGFRCAKDKESL